MAKFNRLGKIHLEFYISFKGKGSEKFMKGILEVIHLKHGKHIYIVNCMVLTIIKSINLLNCILKILKR